MKVKTKSKKKNTIRSSLKPKLERRIVRYSGPRWALTNFSWLSGVKGHWSKMEFEWQFRIGDTMMCCTSSNGHIDFVGPNRNWLATKLTEFAFKHWPDHFEFDWVEQ